MERRTHESHMEWEYENGGATDPTSPFAQQVRYHQQSVFSTPSKLSSRPNPFAQNSPIKPLSPTKPLPPLPQAASFAPHISARNTASPFRNPAFTTPRKPFEEQIFSEQEDSPAPTEASDVPNDTPDADRTGDVVMGGTITPTKIDKASRYGKAAFPSKKHTPGRGEIRAHHSREFAVGDVVRKRKRQNLDRDVGSVARRVQQEWEDSGIDSDASFVASRRSRKSRLDRQQQRGIIGSAFHMLDQYPDAPDYIYKWIQLMVNFSIVFVFLYIGWSVVDTVRSDIRNANEAARLELMSKMTECQTQYTMNECSKKDRPALRMMCEEWYDCMMQNPEAIMRVKVTAKQIAEIINEFSETMNLKAWGFFFAVLLLCAFANNLTLGRHSHTVKMNNGPATAPQPSGAAMHDPSVAPEAGPGFMWVPVQTPRLQQRHRLFDEQDDAGSDTTDGGLPPKMKMLPSYTPSRKSPVKAERGRSPVKSRTSPMKVY